jgi:hypothetical protein
MPQSLRVALVAAALALATTPGALAAQPTDADEAAGGQQTDTAIQKPGHITRPGG